DRGVVFVQIPDFLNEKLGGTRLSAEAARARGQEIAPRHAGLSWLPESHVGYVPHALVTGVTATRAVADPDLGKIVGAFDDALAEQEAGRQVDVVARSAH